ncbi:MAG: bL35 family ribosomal protein [Nitrospirota bacterium]
MKQKTHSGLKKRVKVRKSGTVMVQKSCKNHLLDNKSKRQKKSCKGGMPIPAGRRQSLRRLMPGKVGTVKVKKVRVVAETPVKKAVKKEVVAEVAETK